MFQIFIKFGVRMVNGKLVVVAEIRGGVPFFNVSFTEKILLCLSLIIKIKDPISGL